MVVALQYTRAGVCKERSVAVEGLLCRSLKRIANAVPTCSFSDTVIRWRPQAPNGMLDVKDHHLARTGQFDGHSAKVEREFDRFKAVLCTCSWALRERAHYSGIQCSLFRTSSSHGSLKDSLHRRIMESCWSVSDGSGQRNLPHGPCHLGAKPRQEGPLNRHHWGPLLMI